MAIAAAIGGTGWRRPSVDTVDDDAGGSSTEMTGYTASTSSTAADTVIARSVAVQSYPNRRRAVHWSHWISGRAVVRIVGLHCREFFVLLQGCTDRPFTAKRGGRACRRWSLPHSRPRPARSVDVSLGCEVFNTPSMEISERIPKPSMKKQCGEKWR